MRSFCRHFGKLDEEEEFTWTSFRAMTEGAWPQGNQKMLNIIESNSGRLKKSGIGRPSSASSVPAESVRKGLCLLYTGGRDGVPFPDGLDQKVEKWKKARASAMFRARSLHRCFLRMLLSLDPFHRLPGGVAKTSATLRPIRRRAQSPHSRCLRRDCPGLSAQSWRRTAAWS